MKKNAKIGEIERIELKIFFAAQPCWAATSYEIPNSNKRRIFSPCKGCSIYLNKPEYPSIMSQYEWNCFNNANMIEYTWKKQSAKYARIILNVSDVVHNIRSLNLLSSFRDRCIQNTAQICKIKRFAKRIMPECRWATRNFSGHKEGFVEIGHFDKHFIKNTIRAFLSKISKLFSPWLCACECGWIYINIPEYA